jgi:hypothetical protein
MSSKEALEQFGSCWEGLEHLRCGKSIETKSDRR